MPTSNGVTLDFLEHDGEIPANHDAFPVSEEGLNVVFSRIREHDLPPPRQRTVTPAGATAVRTRARPDCSRSAEIGRAHV